MEFADFGFGFKTVLLVIKLTLEFLYCKTIQLLYIWPLFDAIEVRFVVADTLHNSKRQIRFFSWSAKTVISLVHKSRLQLNIIYV